ncbi:MAG TPA: aminoglycoside phosphotransferase family protein [Nitrospiria bacterium]
MNSQPFKFNLNLAKKVCDRLGVSGSPVEISGPLGGQVNKSFLIVLDNQKKWVLRIDGEVQSFDKIQRESEIYRFLQESAPNLTISKVFLSDCSKEIIPMDYALMEYLPGVGVGENIESLPQKARDSLLKQIGETLKRFHQIKVPGFGFRHFDRKVYPKAESWRKFLEQEFYKELEGVEKKVGYAPRWKDQLTHWVQEWLAIQPEAIDPVFLHGDFHYDNLKINLDKKDTPKLSGIFDLEWAWWGDPVGDFLHLEEAFFLYPQDLAPFLSSYQRSEFPKGELKIHRVLHSLRLFRFWLEFLPEPNWKEVGIYEKRLRNLAKGKGVFE